MIEAVTHTSGRGVGVLQTEAIRSSLEVDGNIARGAGSLAPDVVTIDRPGLVAEAETVDVSRRRAAQPLGLELEHEASEADVPTHGRDGEPVDIAVHGGHGSADLRDG